MNDEKFSTQNKKKFKNHFEAVRFRIVHSSCFQLFCKQTNTQTHAGLNWLIIQVHLKAAVALTTV